MATTEQELDTATADAAEESDATVELRSDPGRIAADFELLSAIGAEAGRRRLSHPVLPGRA